VDTRTALGSSLNNNDVIFSVGAGFPTYLIENQNIIMPSVFVTGDIVIPKRIWGSHFTLGALVGFTATEGDKTTKGSLIADNNISWSTNYYAIALGSRLAYHFNVGIKVLDPYASVGATWVYAIANTKAGNFKGAAYDAEPKAKNISKWYPALSVGLRVFVLPMLGIYAEFGYNNFVTVGGGISFKF